MRYSSSVFTVAKGRTHATKRCKRRHCRSYRLRDILSSISGFANADLYDDINSKSRRMNSYGLIIIFHLTHKDLIMDSITIFLNTNIWQEQYSMDLW